MAPSRDAEKQALVLFKGQDTKNLASLQLVYYAPFSKAKTGSGCCHRTALSSSVMAVAGDLCCHLTVKCLC